MEVETITKEFRGKVCEQLRLFQEGTGRFRGYKSEELSAIQRCLR